MPRGLKNARTDLRAFLTEHRAAVTPAMAGLPAKGLPRRVPGLRRDEIARLLGVATDYYVDLEQGLLPTRRSVRATNERLRIRSGAGARRGIRSDQAASRFFRHARLPAFPVARSRGRQ